MIQQYWQSHGTQIVGVVLLFVINYGIQFIPGLTQHLFAALQHYAGMVKNNYVKGILDRLITLAGQKVLMIEQTEIDFLKKQALAGKVSKDQLPTLLAGAKQAALDAVKTDASAQGLWESALKIFGTNETAMQKWLADVVESQVNQLPPSGLQTGSVPAMNSAPATGGITQPLAIRGAPPKNVAG
jgi:hypothetical protein